MRSSLPSRSESMLDSTHSSEGTAASRSKTGCDRPSTNVGTAGAGAAWAGAPVATVAREATTAVVRLIAPTRSEGRDARLRAARPGVAPGRVLVVMHYLQM